MTAQEKKEVLSHLAEDILRYDLHTREVATRLDMLPIYVTYAKNEKFWDKISRDAWDKFEKWHLSRLALNKYGQYEPEIKPEKPAEPLKAELLVPVSALDELIAETKRTSEKVDEIGKSVSDRIEIFHTRLDNLERTQEILTDDVEELKKNLPAIPEAKPIHQVVIFQKVIQSQS